MNDNPYASSSHTHAVIVRPDVCIDGQYLVVRDNATLPLRCVITNESAKPSDRRSRRFELAPSFRVALGRHRCRLQYCVNRQYSVARNRTRSMTIGVALLVGWLWLRLHIIWSVPLIGLIFAVLATIPRPDPLVVKKAQDGHFWITGFGDAFLNSCENEYERY